MCVLFFRHVLSPLRIGLWLLFSAVVVSTAFWVFDPNLAHYVGLSGLIYGLLVMCLILDWPQHPVLNAAVLGVIAARTAWEQSMFYDPGYLTDVIGTTVYPNSHLYGIVAGVLLGAGLLGYNKRSAGPSTEDAS